MAQIPYIQQVHMHTLIDLGCLVCFIPDHLIHNLETRDSLRLAMHLSFQTKPRNSLFLFVYAPRNIMGVFLSLAFLLCNSMCEEICAYENVGANVWVIILLGFPADMSVACKFIMKPSWQRRIIPRYILCRGAFSLSVFVWTAAAVRWRKLLQFYK